PQDFHQRSHAGGRVRVERRADPQVRQRPARRAAPRRPGRARHRIDHAATQRSGARYRAGARHDRSRRRRAAVAVHRDCPALCLPPIAYAGAVTRQPQQGRHREPRRPGRSPLSTGEMSPEKIEDGFFLGVDGGGTKARFALMRPRKLVAETQLGTSYHPDVGLDGVGDVLAAGVAAILARAGIDASQIAHAFFGLPAYGEDSQVTPVLRALPASILGHERYTCDNDMVCGWAGSLGAEDGINVVAGTGSI